MEREILFRGKRLDNGEWAFGTPLYYSGCQVGIVKCTSKTRIFPYDGDLEFHFVEELFSPKVDPATVGQYTGLTDKNGQKIFEGDVVRTVYDGSENIFVVVWDTDELGFKATNGKENYGPGGFQYMPCCEEVEVIGNIFDGNSEGLW